MATGTPRSVLYLLAATFGCAAVLLLLPQQHSSKLFAAYVWACLWILQITIDFVYNSFIYPFFLSPLRSLPQPKGGKFLIGHGMAIYEQPAGQTFLRWMKAIPNNGLIFYRGILYRDRLLATDVKVLREVLNTRSYDFQRPSRLRDFLRYIVGEGLTVAESDNHKFQRKSAAPAFSFRVVRDLYPALWMKAMNFTKIVTEQIATDSHHQSSDLKEVDSVVEIGELASRTTLDIIGIAVGRDFKTLTNKDHPLFVKYKELTRPSLENQLYYLLNMILTPALVSMLPWSKVRRNRRLMDGIANIGRDVVQEKTREVNAAGGRAGPADILSVLIESQKFTTPQLVDQFLTFIVAGFETTWTTFSWITFLLAKHPDIQSRLRNELLEHLPSLDSTAAKDFDFTALDRLPLLNGVCSEALRLYPSIPVTIREAVVPSQLAGQYIPVGAQVMIVPWAINRDTSLWGDDAEEFKPERWVNIGEDGNWQANNAGGSSSNYGFMTFSQGPRNCIGQDFARAELKILTAAFVTSFDIQMANPNEVVIPYGVVAVKPKNGMHLRLKPLHV